MAYKRVDGKKVAKGILAAVAVYYLGSLLSGVFDSSADAADEFKPDPSPGDADTAAVAAGLGSNLTPQPIPMPEAPEIKPTTIDTPKVAPVQTAQAVSTANIPSDIPTPQSNYTPSPALADTPRIKSPTEENGYGKWLDKLSPNAKAIIAGGMFGGAGALLQANAQKNALEDARAREDRAREDRTRRGAIPAFGDGIIASRRA